MPASLRDSIVSAVRRPVFLFPAFSILLHIIGSVLGAYYPEGSETYMKILASGNISGVPAGTPVTYGALAFISDLIAFCYTVLPAIEWFDVYLSLSSVLAMTLFIHAIYRALNFSEPRKWAAAGAIILGVLIYYENARLLEVTRVSFIHICSLYILVLLEKEKPRLNKILLYILLLLPAMLVRMETVLFCFLLVFPAFVIRMRQIKTRAVWLAIVAVYIPFVAIYYVGWDRENSDYIQFREYQFGLFDYKSKFSAPFENSSDSLSITLARNAYINDPQIIQLLLKDKYVQKQDKNIKQLKNYLAYSSFEEDTIMSKLNKLGKRFRILFFLLPAILISAVLIRRKVFEVYGIMLYYLFLLGAVTVFMKMEERLLLPAIISLFLTLIILYSSDRKAIAAIAGSFALSFFVMNTWLGSTMREQEKVYRYMSCVREELIDLGYGAKEKLALYDLNTINLIGNKATYLNDRSVSVFSFDNGIMCLNEQYRNRSKALFNTVLPVEIFPAITGERYIWVGGEQRLELLTAYYKEVYGLVIGYEKLPLACPELIHSKTPELFRLYKK